MKHTALCRLPAWILAALLLAAPVAAQDDAGSGIFPYTVHSEVLDNGLAVNVIPMPSDGLVSYWSIVRTGARDEYEPGRTGFAHFFEHMMFRGTERFPADVYNQKVTEIGADANAFTSDDITAYYLSFTADDLEVVMDIESDRFQRLSYEEEAFRTEAGAVYGEYRKNRTNPFFTIREAVVKAAFTRHTYGHTAMGYVEDIQKMPEMYDYSRSFFSRYYRPENVTILVVGDVEAKSTLEMARRFYGEWQPGYVPPKIEAEPEQTAERRIDVPYEGRSLPVVWMAYKAPAFDAEDRTAVGSFLLANLAFGSTSDLYKQLVLQDQLVEFVQAGPSFNRDPGLFDIITRVKDPAKVDEVIAAIDAEISRYQSQPPDAKRLADLKSNLKYGFLMGLDTPAAVSRGLVNFIGASGSIDSVDRMYRTMESLTPEDIQAAAQALLQTTRRTVAVLRGEG